MAHLSDPCICTLGKYESIIFRVIPLEPICSHDSLAILVSRFEQYPAD